MQIGGIEIDGIIADHHYGGVAAIHKVHDLVIVHQPAQIFVAIVDIVIGIGAVHPAKPKSVGIIGIVPVVGL